MSNGQERQQSFQPEPVAQGQQPVRPYSGPKNVGAAKDLLAGIDGLVNKGNLAKNYKQSGGQ